jgi:hypothetical protein
VRARRSWAWLLSFAVAASAPGAQRLCAQVPENADFALVYRAPEGCPERAQFERQLRARMPQRAALSARIEVRIAREASKSVGELALARAGSDPAVRRIEAPRCEEVVEALALAAALLLDPVAAAPSERVREPPPPVPSREPARHEPRGGPRVESAPGEAPQPSAAAAATPQAVPPAAVESDPAAAAVAAVGAPVRVAPATPPADRVRRRLTLSAAALVATGVAPAARVGGAFALGLLSQRARRLELAGSAGVRVVQRTSSEYEEGRLEMSWWSASAAACAGAVLGARGALAGCLAGELGRLSAAGSDTSTPASSERLWAALGPALRGRWRALGPLSVESAVLPLFPLFRHRYVLGDETVFSVPRLTFRVELGVSWQFP